MAHQWQELNPLAPDYPRRRQCKNCKVVQTLFVQRGHDADIGPIHITGYYWRPLVGRCPGITADSVAHLFVLDEDEPKETKKQVLAKGRKLGLVGKELDNLWEICQGPIGP